MSLAQFPDDRPGQAARKPAGSGQPSLFWALLLLASLVAAYLLAGPLLAPEDLNCTLPLVLIVSCGLGAFALLRSGPWFVLSPLIWFFIICGIYYGFGPLAHPFGDSVTVAYIQAYYPIDESLLLRTNLLNAACILAVVLSFSAVMQALPLHATPRPPVLGPADRRKFILACLCIGVPIRYILVPLRDILPAGSFLPQQFLVLEELVLIAVVLMARSFFEGDRKWGAILWPLLGWEVVIRLVSGNKQAFFVVLLTVFLGTYLARPNWKMIVGAGFLVALAWLVVVPITNAVRHDLSLGGGGTLAERLETAKSAFDAEREAAFSQQDRLKPWWTRLCYTTAQGFCLDQYDRGDPGDTVGWRYLYWTVVPRVLVADKPKMNLGQMFNELVLGNPYSQSAPGFFGEAYWCGGWWMALAASVYVGTLFAGITHLVVRCLFLADYRWLPLVWQGIIMGLRPDDWFVATYVGSLPIALVTCLLFFVFVPSTPHD